MRRAIGIAVVCLVSASGAAAQLGPKTMPEQAAAGKALFDGKGGCARCHAVDNRGGSLGPELSWIGILRTPDSLRRALTEPDAQIDPRYFTVVAKNGDEQIEGRILNEDTLSIQLRDSRGRLRSFSKADLQDLRREHRSLMPSYTSTFSSAEIEYVVAYLHTLRTMWAIEPIGVRRSIPAASSNVPFFNRPGRDRQERSDELVQALDIAEGATIADIGSGTGYFTWRLARHAGPGGKVIAVDIQQQMLDLTAETIERHKLTNVELVLATPDDPGLAADSLDLAFVGHAYHEFSEPDAMMASLRRRLETEWPPRHRGVRQGKRSGSGLSPPPHEPRRAPRRNRATRIRAGSAPGFSASAARRHLHQGAVAETGAICWETACRVFDRWCFCGCQVAALLRSHSQCCRESIGWRRVLEV